jgi:hypothetical protein
VSIRLSLNPLYFLFFFFFEQIFDRPEMDVVQQLERKELDNSYSRAAEFIQQEKLRFEQEKRDLEVEKQNRWKRLNEVKKSRQRKDLGFLLEEEQNDGDNDEKKKVKKNRREEQLGAPKGVTEEESIAEEQAKETEEKKQNEQEAIESEEKGKET